MYLDSMTLTRSMNLSRAFNDYSLISFDKAKINFFERFQKLQDHFQLVPSKTYIKFTNSFKVIWNEAPTESSTQIGYFLKNNQRFDIFKNKSNKVLFINSIIQPNSQILNNCNASISFSNGSMFLNVWWKVSNIPDLFYKTKKIDMEFVNYINLVEISEEFNAIALLSENISVLYKLDKFQQEIEFIAKFTKFTLFEKTIYLKSNTDLLILNNSMKIIDTISTVDIFKVFRIMRKIKIITISHENHEIKYWSFENNNKVLLQTIPINYEVLEIELIKYENDYFLVIYSNLNSVNLFLFKLTKLYWKLYTSTGVRDISKIVPLKDSSLLLMLINHNFENIKLLSVN